MQATTIKQKQTNRFLRASEIGFATFIFLSVVGESADPATVPVWLRIMSVAAFVACLASLALMFAYRNTDEYTRSLWNAGTSASFISTTLLLVFGGFFEQLFYRFFMPDLLLDKSEALSLHLAQGVLLFMFFAAAQVRRVITSSS